MTEKIQIKTDQDFANFLKKIDDMEYMSNTMVDISVLSITLKIEGDDFDSSLTGKTILALAEYQQKLYKSYKVQVYGQSSPHSLTEIERNMLEIKVTIKPGCTEAVIEFGKIAIQEVLKRMSGEQIQQTIFIVAMIAATAYAIKSIASPIIQGVFKTKREQIKLEIKKLEMESGSKEKIEFLNTVEKINNQAIESTRAVAAKLSDINANTISVDGKQVTLTQIASTPENLRPRSEVDGIEPKTYTVSGKFKILNLDYQKEDTMMIALHEATGFTYKNIAMQKGWLTEEKYATVINAEKREPIEFTIIVTEDGKTMNCNLDINSIKA